MHTLGLGSGGVVLAFRRAWSVCLASEEACREVMRRHLVDYMRANGPNASFQAWVATMHPENVRLDHRMWLDDSEQLRIWGEMGGKQPKKSRSQEGLKGSSAVAEPAPDPTLFSVSARRSPPGLRQRAELYVPWRPTELGSII